MTASLRLPGLVIAVLYVLFVEAAVAGDAGTVRIAIGETWIETSAGERFSISAGQAVPDDATLVTGNGLLQVSFADGGLMSVQKHTRLRIERFAYGGSEDGAEWALFELVRGGVRAISGAIGHVRTERYSLRTAFGTIGIRGTAYNALVCEAECRVEGGPMLAAGLHAQTTEGTIFIRNEAAVLDVPAGRSAFVADAMTAPAFSTFAPDFAWQRTPDSHDAGDGPDDRGNAKPREKTRDTPENPAPETAPSRIAAKTDALPSRVRILSAPGKALVIGMTADIRPSLAIAAARLNADLYGIAPPAPTLLANSASPTGALAPQIPAIASQGLPAVRVQVAARAVVHHPTTLRGVAGIPLQNLALPAGAAAAGLKTAPVTLPGTAN